MTIFDPQMTVISVKCGDVIRINHIFGPFIDIVHKHKLHHWITEMKLNQKSMFCFQNFEFLLLTLFDPFYLTFRSNLKTTVAIGFYVSNYLYNMCRTIFM